MIFILNQALHVVGALANTGDVSKMKNIYFEDTHTEELTTGAETFEFSTIGNTKESKHLQVGNYVAFQDGNKYKLFTITQVEDEHNEYITKKIYSEGCGLELINEIIRPMNISSCNITQFLTAVLQDTEWNVGIIDMGIQKVLSIDITDYSNVYKVLQDFAVGEFGCELSFRVDIVNNRIVGKYVDAYVSRGKNIYHRFEYGRNLSNVKRTVDTTELCTALIGVGNGVTLKDVEAEDKPLNQDFIINQNAYDIWNKNGNHIMGVFKSDTESPHELLLQTREELERRSEPKVTYTLDVELLGKDVELGDTVYIIDHDLNLTLSGRVSILEKTKTNGENKCTLSNFIELKSDIGDVSEIIGQLQGTIDSIMKDKFPVGTDDIQDGAVTSDKVGSNQIYGSHIHANTITGDLIKAETIEGTHIKGETITGDLIQGNTIEGGHIKAQEIDGGHIKGEVIEGTHIKGGTIEGSHITGGTIEGSHIKGETITGSHIVSNSITGNLIQGSTIEGTHIKGSTIEGSHIKGGTITGELITANAISSNHLQANSVGANQLQANAITVGSTVIGDGAIGNAQISNLDATKISSGTIDTSKVSVIGTNGHLQIKGNKLQVFDGVGNKAVERVALGDVNNDGSVYGFRVRGKDGTTVLIDENGVKSEGITNGSITNDKISQGANIDGSKLNINSVINSINADGTETIEGTKINVDGNTLNVKLSNITSKQQEDSQRITQAFSDISANANAIKLKVDNQTYQNDKSTMTSKLEKNTSDISVLKNQISLKVEQSDIETALDEFDEVVTSKVNTAKAEIKVETDGIKQSVSNLTTTVNNKADNSTVSTISNKVATLETGLSGITQRVESTESTTTSLNTKIDNVSTSVNGSINDLNNALDETNNRIDEVSTEVSDSLDDLTGEINRTNTKIDGVVSDVNTANNKINTINGNITNINTEITKTNNKVATMETNLSGITSRVSNVESTTKTINDKVVAHESRLSSAESKITDSAIINTVSSTIDSKVSAGIDIVNGTITDTETKINSNIDGAISGATTDILDTVKNNYTLNSDFSALSESVTSSFKQTSDNITATFETAQKYTKEVDDKLIEYQNTVATNIRFSGDGIELGKTSSPFTAVLDNEKLAFKQNDEEVAYISNNKMYITQAEIKDELRIGKTSTGFFTWVVGNEGNMSLKWIE